MIVLIFHKGQKRISSVLSIDFCRKNNLYDWAKNKIAELGKGWALGDFGFEEDVATFSYELENSDYSHCKLEYLKNI